MTTTAHTPRRAEQPAVVVCRAPEFLRRRILRCPVCKQSRRFAVREAAWYGPTVTCCHCGDSWSDGYRCPRPARRGWRTEAAAKAKQTWQAAGRFDRAAYRRWLADQLDPAASSSGSDAGAREDGAR